MIHHPRNIIAAVALATGIPAGRLQPDTPASKHRDRFVTSARRLAMWIIHEDLDRSLPETAALFNYRSHSTIHEGIQLVRAGQCDAYLPDPATAMRAAILRDMTQSTRGEGRKDEPTP